MMNCWKMPWNSPRRSQLVDVGMDRGDPSQRCPGCPQCPLAVLLEVDLFSPPLRLRGLEGKFYLARGVQKARQWPRLRCKLWVIFRADLKKINHLILLQFYAFWKNYSLLFWDSKCTNTNLRIYQYLWKFTPLHWLFHCCFLFCVTFLSSSGRVNFS